MNLQESGEMYLETILLLSKQNKTVRLTDISKYMGFSKPSVSRAMGLLKESGYIEINDNDIRLTIKGSKKAKKIYERHLVLTDFLIKLGVSDKQASQDACKIEHDISDETFNAIKKEMGNN